MKNKLNKKINLEIEQNQSKKENNKINFQRKRK